MRKWQRDRMRRRKKVPPTGQPAQQPEPLQPMYPDLQQPAAPESEPVPEPAPEPQAGPEPATPGLAQRETGRRSRRRRGGRGGRKRRQGGPIPAPAAAPSQPPALSEVAPELPAAGAPPPSSEQRTPRAPKGVVVLAIGLPGSGKSSWFKRRGVTPLSSDLLRTLLFDNITEQRYQDLVFGTLRSLLRARLIARMPWNYVDATNLSPKERAGWIKMAREFGYEAHAVFFDVPLEVCEERNRRRAHVVPEDVMQRMSQKLRPPTFEEGFSKIIVVRVKRRDEEPTSEMM